MRLDWGDHLHHGQLKNTFLRFGFKVSKRIEKGLFDECIYESYLIKSGLGWLNVKKITTQYVFPTIDTYSVYHLRIYMMLDGRYDGGMGQVVQVIVVDYSP